MSTQGIWSSAVWGLALVSFFHGVDHCLISHITGVLVFVISGLWTIRMAVHRKAAGSGHEVVKVSIASGGEVAALRQKVQELEQVLKEVGAKERVRIECNVLL